MGRAIFKKYLINGPTLKHHLIIKAFIDDDEWISKELLDELKEAAAKVNVYDLDEDAISDWDYEPLGETIESWTVSFHGTDNNIANLQKEILKKDEEEGRPGGPSLDPDEVGMAFIYFYFNLKNGQLYKIESEAIAHS